MRTGLVLLATMSLSGVVGSASAQARRPLPTAEEGAQVRASIAAMKTDPRGPYQRIRWFCADGAVLPPQGTPCVDRGGGVQYAEYSDAALRLADLGFHIGTVYQATPIDTLIDAADANYRLEELVLARYLFAVDDGWALRRARYYRGARQIEDEEARGKALLETLLSRPAWSAGHYLLLQQLGATVPHPTVGNEQTTQRIRNLATEIAVLDTSFTALRIKIHSIPTRDDLLAVNRRLVGASLSPEVQEKLLALREELTRQYDPHRHAAILEAYRRRVGPPLAGKLADLQTRLDAGDNEASLARLAELLPDIRRRITSSADGARNLVLLDLSLALQEQAFVAGQALATDSVPRTRAERLARVGLHLRVAEGAGWLSPRERAAQAEALERLGRDSALTALAYKNALAYASRSLDWAVATARGEFAPVLERYTAVEPKAAGLVDALVRGSILLPLSRDLAVLTADADRLLGTSHTIMGSSISQGVRGLNPGVALAPFAIVHGTSDSLRPDRIYLIPQTTGELRPVAGVMTLEEGNLLSHVQLLARNLEIPNAAIAPSLVPLVEGAAGSRLFYAVSPLGRVVLKTAADMTAADSALLPKAGTPVQKVFLDTRRLRLDRKEPIPLSQLRAAASGVVVGPKAANLGQLMAYFPDRVAPGVALPFGMFYQHVNRPFGTSARTVLEDLAEGYREADRLRQARTPEAEIDRHMFTVLARVREAILGLDFLPETRRAILEAIRATFGDDVADGVFVRSDTNVEDLPQFSGAGLNLTVPHQVSVDQVLASIKRVWTSPFSERAYLWRKQILADQGEIYPSVLLLQSIHSDKSGVLITSGLDAGGPEALTIATAEGVGGAVEGEEAETIVVDSAGRVRLLSQAKAPWRRRLDPAGGVTTVTAERPTRLLTGDEVRQLQLVVAEWQRRFPGARGETWDMEFGFARGRLWLFQIRPFVRFRSSQLLARLRSMDAEVLRNAGRPVALDAPL